MADNNEQITVQAEVRQGRGKNDSRRIRVAGRVPLTIYGGEGEAISVTANLAELAAILRSHSGANTVFSIALEGAEPTEVMFHDRQIHPLKGRLMHADLRRLVRGQTLEITAPLHFVGDAVGVLEGGVLDQVMHELQIRCLPRNIPDAINVDVSALKINDVMHVSDIKVDETIEILSDLEAVVASIKYISEEELEEALTPQLDTAEPIVTDEPAAGADSTKDKDEK